MFGMFGRNLGMFGSCFLTLFYVLKNKENKENMENPFDFFFLKNINNTENTKFRFLENTKNMFFVFSKMVLKNNFQKQKPNR